jgi:hypothetical protein
MFPSRMRHGEFNSQEGTPREEWEVCPTTPSRANVNWLGKGAGTACVGQGQGFTIEVDDESFEAREGQAGLRGRQPYNRVVEPTREELEVVYSICTIWSRDSTEDARRWLGGGHSSFYPDSTLFAQQDYGVAAFQSEREQKEKRDFFPLETMPISGPV